MYAAVPQVTCHTGPDSLSGALYGAHLVIIPAGVPRKPGMTRDDLFNINAGMRWLCMGTHIVQQTYRCDSVRHVIHRPANVQPIALEATILCPSAYGPDMPNWAASQACLSHSACHQSVHSITSTARNLSAHTGKRCCRHCQDSSRGHCQILPTGMGEHHLQPRQFHGPDCS